MIDPEKLRSRLAEVWTALGQHADQTGNEVMRACALTLITVVDEEDDPEGMALTLAELMREHPSRAILVRLEPGTAATLGADVEAKCWMPFGGRLQICSEQIVIRCTEKTLAEAPGVILPLVVPDLPVVLWCASGRARRSEAFQQLAEPAGRVIVDSLLSGGVFERTEGPWLWADLAWTRLTRWRAILAQVFQNEEYRREIPGLREAVVEYAGDAVPPSSWLMAGWLASRLPQARVRLAKAAWPAVDLRSDGARVRVARSGRSCGEIRVEVRGQDLVMNRVALEPSHDVMLLEEELGIFERDLAYEQSVERARRLAGEGAAE